VNGKRLTGRDYKRPRRNSLSGAQASRLWGLGIGFGAGLCIAGVVYLSDHRAPDASAQPQQPTPRRAAGRDNNGAGPPVDTSGGDPPPAESKYDFYQMLPKFEVVVPEKERGTPMPPTAQIDRPGIYFLQVGSYRDADVADRIHTQLTKLGIDSTVQRVAVDNDVWHRVRIGPVKDLGRLNRLRAQLRQSDLDSLVIRVDE
jgi:cell division protein FtsN